LVGLNQRNLPRLTCALMKFDGVALEVKRKMPRTRHTTQKVVLDGRRIAAAANDKIVQTMVRIDSHDVPEHRSAADLNQRLRNGGIAFAELHSVAVGENEHFHPVIFFCCCCFDRDQDCGSLRSNLSLCEAAKSELITVNSDTAPRGVVAPEPLLLWPTSLRSSRSVAAGGPVSSLVIPEAEEGRRGHGRQGRHGRFRASLGKRFAGPIGAPVT
jgi:hypothetical protein